MYAKHFFRTCGNSACTHLALGIRFRVYIRLVLDHLVRKTYHIYMHSDPNSACTKKVFCVHAEILHVHIWRWGVLEHLARKTPHLHALGPQFCMYTPGIHMWTTNEERVDQTKGPLHPPGGPPNEGCKATTITSWGCNQIVSCRLRTN